ncbi:MAG: hypothetical protein UY96_C0037G0007 [Parcubacteria group bacterium GW2011_GWB1_56_8]|nr:MAG: hypothetical protein UY96_C0037G0007 [Parcubacteria group bacterium GW2011_GWB1_56_8]
MGDKIVNLIEMSNDARHWSPEQLFEEALRRLKSGEITFRKAVVVFWDEEQVCVMRAGSKHVEESCYALFRAMVKGIGNED